MIAASMGHSEVVAKLIDAGAAVNLQESKVDHFSGASSICYTKLCDFTCQQRGGTALIVASTGGHEDTVRVLMEAEADLDVQTWVNIKIMRRIIARSVGIMNTVHARSSYRKCNLNIFVRSERTYSANDCGLQRTSSDRTATS
jgi:ankyrin repeat protein